MAFHGAIFDLDGLLIDSEPFWRSAQIIALSEVGVNLTEELQYQTTGLGLEAALEMWRKWFPHASINSLTIHQRLNELALDKIATEGRAQPGAIIALEICQQAGCTLAIASSSSPQFIKASVKKMGVEAYFHALVSAEDVERGKPHPDVYLAAAKWLGLKPSECIAFEDSVPGLLAAKAAGMFCIAVPSDGRISLLEFSMADLVLDSLEKFNLEMLSPRG